MPESFEKFRKVFIIGVAAVFIGLPFGFVFLDIFSERNQFLFNVVSLIVFVVAGGFLGNLIANKIERYDARYAPKIRTQVDAEIQRGRENWARMTTLVLGIIFVVFLFYALAHNTYSSAPWAGLIILFLLVVAFFFFFLLYDKNKSLWTKRFYFMLFVVLLTNFAIVAVQLLMRSGTPSPTSAQTPYEGMGTAVTLGAYGTPLGAVTVVLPVGFETVPLNADAIFIRPTGSAAAAELPSLVVGATSSSVQAVLGRQRALLAEAQYTESTTTFAGYPANSISFVQTNGEEQTVVSAIVFEANGSTFDVAETIIVSPASYQAPDDALREILKSMKIRHL